MDIKKLLPDAANPKTRIKLGRAKNGYYPYDFNFVTFQKGNITQCCLCGIFRQSRKLTREHTWPKSLGGIRTYPACKSCNQAKTNMKPIEWVLEAYKTGRDIAVIPRGYEPDADVT